MPDGLPADESAEELYEHAPCGYLTTAGGRVVRVNATFLAWTGLDRDAVVGARFADLLTPGGRMFYETHLAPMLELQGGAREIALEVRCVSGVLPVLLNAVVRKGEPPLVRLVLIDARERRSQERELVLARRAERRARMRTDALQALTAALLAAGDRRAVGEAVGRAFAPAVGARSAALEVDGVTAWRTGDAGDEVTVLPLEARGARLGALRLELGAPPADEDAALLEAGAAQCAQALDRVLLHEATVLAGERAALLARLGSELSELRTAGERASRLVELLVPAVADAAVVDVPAEAAEVAGVFAVEGVPPPELATVAAQRTEALGEHTVALVLRGRGRSLGTLALHRERPFAPAEHDHLRAIADRAGLALDNARLADHERSIAHVLQRSLLAVEPPRDARLRLATHYRPATAGLEVGGDWYDAFPVAEDRVAVVVGDVVGRGLQAASAMGQLRSAIRALAAARLGPAELLDRLDRFVAHQPAARMATVAYVELALDTGAARYACAGHPPPVRAHADGTELLWDGRSAPLGAYLGAARRPEGRLVLARGDRLLLYTDGLVERRGTSLGDRLDHLAAVVGERLDVAPGLLVRHVTDRLLDETAEDDVCLLALAYGVGSRFERVVPADPAELAPLRADLRTWLAGNDVDPADRSAVVLACAEAVSNGIEHGLHDRPNAAVEVRGRVAAGTVELSVRDRGRWVDRPPRADRGRGLQIIRSVMDDVEVGHDHGTVVRMRLRRAAAEQAA